MMPQTAFSVLLFLLVGIFHIEALMKQEEIKDLAKKCKGNDADTQVALEYKVPDTPSGKCLMLCLMKEVKTLTPEGEYVENVALQSLVNYWPDILKSDLEKIAHTCANQMASMASQKNTCEYAYKAITCINGQFVEAKLLPTPKP